MHVKEQVKDFVHDVKSKFSNKHKRDTCSSFDSYDYSSADTVSHLDSSSSSCVSIDSRTPERSRFIRFIRPRLSSTASKKEHRSSLLRPKRYRLFSAPSVPSERMVEPIHKLPVSYQGPGSSVPTRDAEFSQDFPDVIDISARDSAKTDSVESIQSSSSLSQYDSLSPAFDGISRSDTSGTLVSSTNLKISASESDSRFHSVDLNSDKDSEDALDALVSPCVVDPMADVPPPPPPPKPVPSPRDEEIAIAPSILTPSQQPRPAAPAQLAQSTCPSPAPVCIPRLTAPSMFLPIPNTDPLSALLTKYVPAEQRPRRDVVGEYAGRDVQEMVMSNSWRALAKMARDKIVASDPEDLGRILDLWSLRLSSLARLRLTNQASAECTNLFAVLNAAHATSVPGTFPGSGSLTPAAPHPSSPAPAASSPLSPSGLNGLAQLPGTPSQKPSVLPPLTTSRQGTNELVHPFELTVFQARVHYWSGDPLGYVDALSRIMGNCKERARQEARIVAQRRELEKRRDGDDIGGIIRLKQTSKGKGENDGEDQDDNKAEDGSEDGEKKDVEQGKSSEVSKEEAEDDEDQDENEAEVGSDDGRKKVVELGKSLEDVELQTEEEELDNVLVAAEANLSMWLERIARVCLILASQMIEMNDYQAAINLLVPLCSHRAAPTLHPTPTPELHSALARIYLLSGNLQKAEEHFSIAASVAANGSNGSDILAMNTALLAAASGEWTRAEEALSKMVTNDPGNFTAINNLAVTLLCQGRIKEGIDLLEAALQTSPSSVVVAEPFLFNLSTLYELRSTATIDKKRGLLLEVAKWSGDGLKTSCLKMPSS